MLNKVMLIGNLGQNPEVKTIEGGDSYAILNIATNKSWKDKQSGEKKTKTSWHRAIVWGKGAEIISKYCKSGSKIYIEGELETRSFGEGTEKKWITEVVVKNFNFLDSAPSGTQASSEPANNVENNTEEDDDLPF